MAKKTFTAQASPQTQDAFAIAMLKWQDALNLKGWRLVRDDKPAAKANMAEIFRMSLSDRLAVYRVGQDFGTVPVTEQSVDEIACHEALHVLLHPLMEACKEAATTADEMIDGFEHEVINTLVAQLTKG